MKITKGYRCEKCNSVVSNLDERTTVTQRPDVRTSTAIEGLDSQKKQAYKEARHKLKAAKDVFERLSKKHANF